MRLTSNIYDRDVSISTVFHRHSSSQRQRRSRREPGQSPGTFIWTGSDYLGEVNS